MHTLWHVTWGSSLSDSSRRSIRPQGGRLFIFSYALPVPLKRQAADGVRASCRSSLAPVLGGAPAIIDIPQEPAHNFAGAGNGHSGHELGPRQLVGRQMPAAVLDPLSAEGGTARLPHDIGL